MVILDQYWTLNSPVPQGGESLRTISGTIKFKNNKPSGSLPNSIGNPINLKKFFETSLE